MSQERYALALGIQPNTTPNSSLFANRWFTHIQLQRSVDQATAASAKVVWGFSHMWLPIAAHLTKYHRTTAPKPSFLRQTPFSHETPLSNYSWRHSFDAKYEMYTYQSVLIIPNFVFIHVHIQPISLEAPILEIPYLETASWLEASSRQIPPTLVLPSSWSSSPGGGDNARRKLSACLAKPKLLESILPIGMLLVVRDRAVRTFGLFSQILEARQITLPPNQWLKTVAIRMVPPRWICYTLASLHHNWLARNRYVLNM